VSTVDAWEAFQRGGVDPRLDVPPVVGADDDSPFLRVAAPVLLRTADRLADSRTCLSLADRQGRVVWVWVSDGRLERGVRPVRHAIRLQLQTNRKWARAASAPRSRPAGHRAADHLMQGEHRLLQAFLRARGRTTAPVLAVTEDLLLTDPAASELGLDHAETWARVTEGRGRGLRGAAGRGPDRGRRPGQRRPPPRRRRADAEEGDTVAAPVALPESRPGRRLTPLEHAESDVIAATSSPPRWPSSRPSSDSHRARGDPATPRRTVGLLGPSTIERQCL
jgi:hypothetical protein